MTDHPTTPASSAVPERSSRWVGAALLFLAIVVPMLILVVSNTESATVAWAGFEWEAPRWVVLAATFAAGAVGGKVLGWAWRGWRRRRRNAAA